MSTTTLEVSGMTCGHCVSSVTTALHALGHVTDVGVELHSGGNSRVTVSHDAKLGLDQLAGAIAQAGYTVEAVTAQS